MQNSFINPSSGVALIQHMQNPFEYPRSIEEFLHRVQMGSLLISTQRANRQQAEKQETYQALESKHLRDKNFPLAIEWKPSLDVSSVNNKNEIPNFEKHVNRIRTGQYGNRGPKKISSVNIGQGQ